MGPSRRSSSCAVVWHGMLVGLCCASVCPRNCILGVHEAGVHVSDTPMIQGTKNRETAAHTPHVHGRRGVRVNGQEGGREGGRDGEPTINTKLEHPWNTCTIARETTKVL